MESKKIFANFKGHIGEEPLSNLCQELLREQKAIWPQLREGHRALENALIRDIPHLEFTLKAQWNQKRIVSTGARLDPASIRARPCFLCRENLPEAQQAILYRETYFILCNPAPIFPQHFTITHIQHRPQAIHSALDAFLTLIQDFSPDFTVFYNGPRSGASAPDHLHFQAVPACAMPVEGDLHAQGRLQMIKQVRDIDIFQAVNLGRSMLMLEGAKKNSILSVLSDIISAMKTDGYADNEPMMNLLGSYRGNRWRILLFPRRRNRPSVYDRPGDDRILISPGGVEMGGFFITPVEKDFRILDAELVKTVFKDVSVDEETVTRMVGDL